MCSCAMQIARNQLKIHDIEFSSSLTLSEGQTINNLFASRVCATWDMVLEQIKIHLLKGLILIEPV